jgi:hypothetical protein
MVNTDYRDTIAMDILIRLITLYTRVTRKQRYQAEKYACVLADGAIYDIRDFERIKIADVMDTFGDTFVEAMTDGLYLKHEKIGEVLEVMTEIEKAVFTDIVSFRNFYDIVVIDI